MRFRRRRVAKRHVRERDHLLPAHAHGERGASVPGKPVPYRTPEEAIRRTEKALAAGPIAGAHVVRVAVEADAEEWDEPEYLASFDAVPKREWTPSRPGYIGTGPPRCRRRRRVGVEMRAFLRWSSTDDACLFAMWVWQLARAIQAESTPCRFIPWLLASKPIDNSSSNSLLAKRHGDTIDPV